MKIVVRILSLVVLASAPILYMNCNGDDNGSKSDEEVQLDKLVGTWSIVTATLDGTDRISDFDNLVLTIAGTFSSTGGTYNYSFTGSRPNPSPWPENGTWTFGSNVNTQLLRLNDNLGMNYQLNQNNAQLTITFTYNGPGFAGGRVEVVNGNWSFTFNKQ